MSENSKINVPQQEQLDIINASIDEPIIVSASAGSGKTFVVIKRIVRMITDEENKLPANKLAIMTFTKKAAAELRERLSAEITQMSQEQPDNDYLRKQLMLLEDASISTISSFCVGLLRSYSGGLEIPTDFMVLDETISETFKVKARELTIDYYYNQLNKNTHDVLELRFGSVGNRKLLSAIDTLYKFSGNLPNYENWLKNTLATLSDKQKFEADFLPLIKLKINDFIERAKQKVNDYEKCAGLNISEEKLSKKISIDVAKIYDVLETIQSAVNKFDVSSPLKLSGKDLKFPSKPAVAKGTIIGGGVFELREKAKSLLANAVDLFQLLLSIDDDRKDTAVAFAALAEITQVFIDNFQLLKEEKKGLDFSDIEQLTLTLLRDENGNPTDVCSAVRDSLDYIIVDEFQDSNDLQYEIFKMISRDTKNLFLVGDIKQSIYRFRDANPKVFARLLEKDSGYRTMFLSKNFRCAKPIIDLVNTVFTGTMTKNMGGIDYDETQKLVYGASYQSDENNNSELVIIKCPKSIATERIEKEAQYAASRINQMLINKFPVTEKSGVKRPCRPSDFAVIMRSDSKNGRLFADALEKYAIASQVKAEKNYTDLNEISLIMNILRSADNPHNDAALINLTLSPILRFTDKQLAFVKAEVMRREAKELALDNHQKVGSSAAANSNSLYSSMLKFVAYAEINKSLQKNEAFAKTQKAVEFIGSLAKTKADYGVTALVRDIFEKTDIIPFTMMSFGGAKRVSNLYMILKYAGDYESLYDGGLSGFISYIDNINNARIKLSQASPIDKEEFVQIMAIHSSKGLEFPIVFLTCVNTKYNFSDSSDKQLFDIDLGAAFKLYNSKTAVELTTALSYFLAENEREMTESEELRLLYVAMTRAREKLICIAAIDYEPDKDFNVGIQEKSYLPLLLKAFPNDSYTAYFADEISDEEKTVSASHPQNLDCDELYSKIFNNVVREYRYKEYTSIPAKFSATQLDSIADDAENVTEVPISSNNISTNKSANSVKEVIVKPSFVSEGNLLTSNQKGNLYHKIMRFIDFNRPAKEQIDAFYNNKQLTKQEYRSINPDEIDAFIFSDLGKRAAAADNDNRLFREFLLFTEFTPQQLKFSFQVPGDDDDKPFVQGVADMFFIENNEIVLVDYKTNRTKNEFALKEQYKNQLVIYDKALTEMLSLPVKERYIFSFTLKKCISI